MAQVLVIYQGESASELQAVDGILAGSRRLRAGVYLLASINVSMARLAAAAGGLREGQLLWLTIEDDALQSGPGMWSDQGGEVCLPHKVPRTGQGTAPREANTRHRRRTSRLGGPAWTHS